MNYYKKGSEFFPQKSNTQIPMTFQSDVEDLKYFKLIILIDLSTWMQRYRD